ncbi:hypothetical protein ACXYTJ_09930 [Gilvimarinus sp. F26214L]|uniref:hypothetical protein n=1 Tax=Gilvimarinus sp. DZF01 TaxID=3461371 RepID=UPI0040466A2E
MLMFISLLGVALFLLGFYLWYLSWPTVAGRVVRIEEGRPTHSPAGREGDRLLVYTYQFDGREYVSRRQGLFVKAAMGPNKSPGDTVLVSVCSLGSYLSCPRRPLFEGGILLSVLFLFGAISGLGVVLE